MQVTADGYAVKISWKQSELTRYSKKLKNADNLQDLLPSDAKITYTVKMTSKDKSVHSVYRYLKYICVFSIYLLSLLVG